MSDHLPSSKALNSLQLLHTLPKLTARGVDVSAAGVPDGSLHTNGSQTSNKLLGSLGASGFEL